MKDGRGMIELKIDPEFEDLFDPKTSDEVDELERNMIAYGGAYEAIKVWNDNGVQTILDGHNRWRVIQKHPELEYTIQEIKTVHSRLEAKIWILENAYVSKTLSSIRKIEIAEMLRPLYEEQAKKRQGERTDLNIVLPGAQSESGKVVEKIARIAGVGRATVQRYEAVMKEGTPEQIAAMKSGAKAIKTVYNEIRPPKPKQQEAPEDQNEEEVETSLTKEQIDGIQKFANEHPEMSYHELARHLPYSRKTITRWVVQGNENVPEQEKQHSECGEKIVQGIKLTKRIAEIDRLMSDPSKKCTYTTNDAEEEFEVIMNEFMSKIRRVIEVRSDVVKGNKKLKSLICKFSTAVKQLKEEI